MSPVRILLVDDHPLLRKGVLQLLELEQRFVAVGEAGSGEQALALARQHRPDLILLDLNMAGMQGVEILTALREAGVRARVVVLTVSDSEEDVVAALRAGADGYLLKDMEPEDLMACLHQAAAGKLVISEELMPVLARALGRPDSAAERDRVELTAREQDILQFIVHGFSNKMIARELGIAEGTIKVHVKNLLKKLKLRSRVEAAVWAVNRGIG